MNKRKLVESAAPPVKAGNRWRVIVARPGQGSSGNYSESVIRETGPKALAPGAKAFVNHDAARDPEKMIGTFPDGGYWDEDEKALVAELDVFPHWKDFVESVGPHAGMSIYMMGESDEDGNVTALIPDTQNGADLVSYPGLEGSGFDRKLYESAISAESNETGANAALGDNKEIKMTEEQMDTLLAAIAAPNAAAADAAKAEVQANVDKAALDAAIAKGVEEAVAAFAAKTAQIEAARADLLPSQVESITDAARTGADVAPLIESAKAVVAEARALTQDTSGSGRLFGSVTESAIDLGKVL